MFCEITTLDLSYVVTVKSTVEILQNFVAFSEYMNFNNRIAEGTLSASLLLSRQSAAPSIKLFNVDTLILNYFGVKYNIS